MDLGHRGEPGRERMGVVFGRVDEDDVISSSLLDIRKVLEPTMIENQPSMMAWG